VWRSSCWRSGSGNEEVRRRSRQVCGGAGLRFDVSSSGLQREERERDARQ